jgi:hypothetical protein
MWSEAMEEMKTDMEDKLHVRRLKDVGPERFGEIQSRNRYWMEYLARMQGMSAQQYAEEEGYQENLILGPNNVWQKLLTTNEAMSFTLQDILETEKKQLEGMWNIPSGATFWVPLTSLFYQSQQGGGGVPELPPLEDVEPKDTGEDMSSLILEMQDRLFGPGGRKPDDTTATFEDKRFDMFMERYEAIMQQQMVKPGDVDLVSAEGNQLINALKDMAGATSDPEAFYREQLKIVESLAGGDTTAVDMIGMVSDLIELTKAFQTATGDQLDSPSDLAIIGDALRELIPTTADERETAVAPYDKAFSNVGKDIETSVSNVWQGIQSAAELMRQIAEQPTAQINVRLPDITREINVSNVVTLDGSIIKRYVSTILATETGKSARSSGYSGRLEA